nr:hypothetical protein Iba_chr11bCG13730 [Ipomoea batatas]
MKRGRRILRNATEVEGERGGKRHGGGESCRKGRGKAEGQQYGGRGVPNQQIGERLHNAVRAGLKSRRLDALCNDNADDSLDNSLYSQNPIEDSKRGVMRGRDEESVWCWEELYGGEK